VEAEFVVKLPEGIRRFPLKPLFDAQELDGRSGGMPVYWEGAVTTPGGRGYLELTGYAGALAF
jgi:predicted secreted hydrolase